MANRMIIDASHPEETRVVVLRGNRVEEFDFESASKRPLRGNIYLAKVTRVEPSLQAAFVDYGGNRHGFLAFSEIHPDYYQIPVADRQALLEEEALSHRNEEEEPNGERRSRRHRRSRQWEAEARAADDDAVSEPFSESADLTSGQRLDEPAPASEETDFVASPAPEGSEIRREPHGVGQDENQRVEAIAEEQLPSRETHSVEDRNTAEASRGEGVVEADRDREAPGARNDESATPAGSLEEAADDDDHEVTALEDGSEAPIAPASKQSEEGEPVEQVGGDALEEVPRRPARLRRQYKIQEVIKRRQVLLVQVVKEERGNKGAALTTYLSLAGRYSVLMPNTARGGGISRKITNAQDRSRLKAIAEELEVPEGMGVILRTAGASRTKAEVKRDFEYLLRMWETVRETTLASSAPTLVYEEGSLIKRAIRDLYAKDVEEVIVAGESAYREARQFMRLLMPSHVNVVQLYRDTQPIFAKAGVEAQLDAMFSNQVTLKSGGYIVINQTEALVAIDVNSGRSTREHNIEDTALRTNLEAADEIARQLRLRDLAGLIVVDFIDMEESRNNRAVERRIKDALKNDRARIQVGRISHFGLLEMSRQRIRTGVLEGSTVVCPHCQGSGVIRSTASIALHVLRVLEDALIKSSTHDVVVRTRSAVALYILNQKRANLRDLEERFGVAVTIEADDTLTGANYHAIERAEPAAGVRAAVRPPPLAQDDFVTVVDESPEVEEEGEEETESVVEEEAAAEEGEGSGDREALGRETEDGDGGRRRRRRRRRRGNERLPGESFAPDAPQPTDEGLAVVAEIGGDLEQSPRAEPLEARPHRGDGERGRRPRRPRGGRNRFPPRAREESFGEPGEPLPLEELPGQERSTEETGPAPVAPEAEAVAVEASATEAQQARPPVEEAPTEALQTAAEPETREAEGGAPEAHELSPVVEEAPVALAPPPAAEEPRPRRTGWWQRARATIVGS